MLFASLIALGFAVWGLLHQGNIISKLRDELRESMSDRHM